MNRKLENLKRMLSPKGIAFIGKYSIIRQGIKNCKQMGFKGKIYAVHQTRTEIEGIPCYKSISELPSYLNSIA